MKCPHCLVTFHDEWINQPIGADVDHYWSLQRTICPACRKFVFKFRLGLIKTPMVAVAELQVYPMSSSRPPLPPEVPTVFAQEYRESALVLAGSPKASAALSRRSLQTLLRQIANVKPADLSKEIEAILASRQLPTQLAEAVDAIRNLGNFAAHPIKSTNTGEIVDVEPGEAEWLLDILDGLFDFYFVQPALLQKKKDALNKKLKDAGKPPMK